MIREVVCKASVVMLHEAIRWSDILLDELWHIVPEHSALLHNKTLIYESLTTEAGQEEFNPMEIFYGSTNPWKDDFTHPLRWSRVWGCPTYVLDPVLPDGGNIYIYIYIYISNWPPCAPSILIIGW